MFKLLILAALLAIAASEPGIAYSAPVFSRSIVAPIAAPLTVAAPVASYVPQVAVSAPVARIAVPAPVTYSTGAEVTVSAEPVEQHGYRIAY